MYCLYCIRICFTSIHTCITIYIHVYTSYVYAYSNIRISIAICHVYCHRDRDTDTVPQITFYCDSFHELRPDLVQKNDEILSQTMLKRSGSSFQGMHIQSAIDVQQNLIAACATQKPCMPTGGAQLGDHDYKMLPKSMKMMVWKMVWQPY